MTFVPEPFNSLFDVFGEGNVLTALSERNETKGVIIILDHEEEHRCVISIVDSTFEETGPRKGELEQKLKVFLQPLKQGES